MSNISIGIRIPPHLHKWLEDCITETHATKTEVILTPFAKYLGATEEISLSQRIGSLEVQVAELRNLVKSNISVI